jgi:5-methyltetrahydropteroyltriglutamate--homocysteine methyltransferase
MLNGLLETRAHHIGSFLRPATLREAHHGLSRGLIDAASLRATEDDCIRNIVEYQETLGFAVLTDGEFRRRSWRSIVVERVPGFRAGESVGEIDMARDEAGSSDRIGAAPVVESLIDTGAAITRDDLGYLLRHTRRKTKATLPSPSYMHFLRGDRTFEGSPYEDGAQYFGDLVVLYLNEIERLASMGVSCVQLDEVAVTAMCDPNIRAKISKRGEDSAQMIRLYVSALAEIIRRRPKSIVVGIHMCRGNYKGKWLASGSYDYLVESYFENVKPDVFFMEFDSERAGGFEVLHAIDPNTPVVLGLVSTKSGALENPDILMRNIEKAAAFGGVERLGLSPQCGFASHFDGNPITFEQQTRKLELVLETAAKVWRDA